MARVIGCITTLATVSLLAHQQPTIRSRTTLVPVDVRVVDAAGNPVTDLARGDFIVEEDGVRQDIRLFEKVALALVGEHWQVVDLDLTDANYEAFKSRGLSYTQTVPVKAPPGFVKVVAYDYAGDVLGTAVVTVARR